MSLFFIPCIAIGCAIVAASGTVAHKRPYFYKSLVAIKSRIAADIPQPKNVAEAARLTRICMVTGGVTFILIGIAGLFLAQD